MSHGITHNDHMFSVRTMPWHRLGVVLDEYPKSIDEALDKAVLGWKVTHGDVLVVKTPEWTDDFGAKPPPELIRATGFKANLREDTGEVLGIVSNDYEVVDNRDAFPFLDALIGSELRFETAGSLWSGRRVWCLARLPEYIELGGDPSAIYIYVANSHDGSMAVTAAVTPIRIVCANTLGAALRHAEHGVSAQRTFRFRHTSEPALERRVLRHLWVIDDDTGPRARANREHAIEQVLAIFGGRGQAGDTTGNSPRTKWVAFNAIAEHLDYGSLRLCAVDRRQCRSRAPLVRWTSDNCVCGASGGR